MKELHKLIGTFCLASIMTVGIVAQDKNNIQLPHMKQDHGRREINIPDVLGYKTLKCDFHMHTIFSDGVVWPEVRVHEAWEEGLDAISITDHIENQPSKKFVGGDHNSSYDVSVDLANSLGIILIRGGEITRSMPPGHLNALFLDDANALDTETPFQAIEAAVQQGAFIQWNHPGWKSQQPDTCMWWPEHEELYTKGWLHGIEVFNEKEWYPIALDWCMVKDLSVIGNSDIHDVNGHYYDIEHDTRPITLVLSKDKTQKGIKEAMFAKRTLAYFDNKLAGKEEFVDAIFKASVQITSLNQIDSKGRKLYAINNSSDIDFLCELEGGNKLEILANRTIHVPVSADVKEVAMKVTNLILTSERNYETTIVLPE